MKFFIALFLLFSFPAHAECPDYSGSFDDGFYRLQVNQTACEKLELLWLVASDGSTSHFHHIYTPEGNHSDTTHEGRIIESDVYTLKNDSFEFSRDCHLGSIYPDSMYNFVITYRLDTSGDLIRTSKYSNQTMVSVLKRIK